MNVAPGVILKEFQGGRKGASSTNEFIKISGGDYRTQKERSAS